MIKLEKWFPDDMITEYRREIVQKVIKLNGGNNDLTYLRYGKEHPIDINDLLTLSWRELKSKYHDGLKLYIYLCGLEQYKNLTAREIMDTLVSCDPDVKKTDDDEYLLPDVDDSIKFSDKMSRRRDDLIKKEEFETIRKFLIEKIQQYDRDYYDRVVKLNPDYEKSKKSFAETIKFIRKDLDESLNLPTAGTAPTAGGYDDKNYIIHYRLLSDSLRHTLLCSLGVTTCPYCNRQYITGYIDENKKKTTADLDHFYQKGTYPLFALSLFNFIPSCQICNSRMKGEKQIHSLYPYEEGFEDNVKFCLNPKEKYNNEKELLKSWLGDSEAIERLSIDFEFCEHLDEEFKNRAEGSIKLFKLKQVYDIHKAKALDIVLKKRIYLEGSYKEFMSTLMKELSLSCTDEDIIDILVGYHWKDGGYDEPLSKLAHDIFYK